jgi:hypothetical protein
VDLLLDSILVVGSARAQTYPLLLRKSGKNYQKIEECVRWVFLLSPGSANNGVEQPLERGIASMHASRSGTFECKLMFCIFYTMLMNTAQTSHQLPQDMKEGLSLRARVARRFGE